MKKEQIIKELLELSKEMSELHNGLEKILCEGNGELSVFYKYCDKVNNLIFKMVGIPEDNTTEVDIDNPDFFCRDGYDELIYEYSRGKIKIEKVIDKIINWNNNYYGNSKKPKM